MRKNMKRTGSSGSTAGRCKNTENQLLLFPDEDFKGRDDMIVYKNRKGEIIGVKVEDLRKIRYVGCRVPLTKVSVSK
jgi:hypothetical protein